MLIVLRVVVLKTASKTTGVSCNQSSVTNGGNTLYSDHKISRDSNCCRSRDTAHGITTKWPPFCSRQQQDLARDITTCMQTDSHCLSAASWLSRDVDFIYLLTCHHGILNDKFDSSHFVLQPVPCDMKLQSWQYWYM